MGITEIFPPAASRLVDTQLTITGFGLVMGATVVITNCDTATAYDLSAGAIVAADGGSLVATLLADPTREQGIYTVTVTNPSGDSDSLACAFRILSQPPPTVTNVTPTTAYSGMAGDGIQSDELVTITGTGFISTPSVRWVKTDGTASYDALLVGFVSATQLTAVVPSETLHMAAGDYFVFVTNPDLLGAQWLVGGTTPGIFQITTTPPPIVTDVLPPRVELGVCDETLTITGGGFSAGAQVYYIAPPGTTCAGSIIDGNGNTLCPMVVEAVAADGSSITVHFDPCPGTGAWPVVVVNPDGQSDTFFSVQVTPSSDGHLNVGAFEIVGTPMNTPRWKHGATYGFDPFGSAYLFIAGGQDAAGAVVATVEASQLSIFGDPGPFVDSVQYLDPMNLRVLNTLAVPRQGATLVRAGRDLYLIGGAATATDTTTTVPALASVERARILSYDEMPGIHLPTSAGGSGLAVGAWYYQVAAIGPWGESLGSREVVLLNQGGEVSICWDEPAATGATGYNIYRSLASDGRSNSTAVLAVAVPAPCYTDTGFLTDTPAPGRLRGNVAAGGAFAAGTYSYRISATIDVMGTPWETYAGYPVDVELTDADLLAGNASLHLLWDPIPGATYNLYRWEDAAQSYLLLDTGGALTSEEFIDGGAALDASMTMPRVEIAPLGPGSLSTWTELDPTQHLLTPREGLDGIVLALDPATSMGVAARILVAGGRTDNTNTASYLTTAESIGILEDGTLQPAWVAESAEFVNARAYYALLTTQGRNATPFPPPPEEPPCGDLDGDGFVDCACAPIGTPADCNDADPTIHPGAPEICGDGIDQDCDLGCTGTDLPCLCMDDLDSDGYISLDCGGLDCCDTGLDTSLGCSDPNAPGINPGSAEICGDGIDQDCDGVDPPCLCMDDADMDGFIDCLCLVPNCDCVDTDPLINPGAIDICNDGIDQDCDGSDNVCVTKVVPDSGGAPSTSVTWPMFDLIGGEPVYVLGVFGDDTYAANNNAGRSDFEACLVDPITGMLVGTSWTVQADTDPLDTFGADALLYFSYMFPFYAVFRETVSTSPSTRTFVNSAIGRFPVTDPAVATAATVLGNRQSASTSFALKRTHYQMTRLMSYVFVLGGWAEAHTLPDGTNVPEGPTGTIERHDQ